MRPRVIQPKFRVGERVWFTIRLGGNGRIIMQRFGEVGSISISADEIRYSIVPETFEPDEAAWPRWANEQDVTLRKPKGARVV